MASTGPGFVKQIMTYFVQHIHHSTSWTAATFKRLVFPVLKTKINLRLISYLTENCVCFYQKSQ